MPKQEDILGKKSTKFNETYCCIKHTYQIQWPVCEKCYVHIYLHR